MLDKLWWSSDEEEREIYEHLDVKQWQISWPTNPSILSTLFYITSSGSFLIPPGPGIFCQSQYFKKLHTLVLILPIKLSEGSPVCDCFFQFNFTNRLLVFYVLRAEARQRVVKHASKITWVTIGWLAQPSVRVTASGGLLFWMTLIIFYLSILILNYILCSEHFYIRGPVLTSQPAVIDNQGNLAWQRSAELPRYKNSPVVILSSKLKQEKEVLY